MASVGVAVAILGGLVAMIAGASRSDWAMVGLGIGLIGIAFVLGDAVVGAPVWRDPHEGAASGTGAEPEPPDPDDEAAWRATSRPDDAPGADGRGAP